MSKTNDEEKEYFVSPPPTNDHLVTPRTNTTNGIARRSRAGFPSGNATSSNSVRPITEVLTPSRTAPLERLSNNNRQLQSSPLLPHPRLQPYHDDTLQQQNQLASQQQQQQQYQLVQNQTTTTTTKNGSTNNDDSHDSEDNEEESLEQQQLQQHHSCYTTIHVQVPYEPLLPGNRMVIDLPVFQEEEDGQEEEEGTVPFEISVPRNIAPGTIIPVQVPTQQHYADLQQMFLQQQQQQPPLQQTPPKKRKKKNPKVPKRPKSAYNYFCSHIRPTVRNENPEASKRDINRILGDRWEAVKVNTDQRKEWDEKAAPGMIRYGQQMTSYVMGDFDDVSTTSPKKKRKKDPNAPKRGRTAYTFFSWHNRPTVRKENPGASFGDISRIIGARWKAVKVNNDQRKQWDDKALADKVRYEHEILNYKKKDTTVFKRRRTTWNYFYAHIRPTVAAENPGASMADISRIIGARWKAVKVNNDQREQWDEKAAADTVGYEHEMLNDVADVADDDASTAITTSNHHLREHMTYKDMFGREKTTFFPEVKLAIINDQGEIVAGNYFIIMDGTNYVEIHSCNNRKRIYRLLYNKSPVEVDALCNGPRMTKMWEDIINNNRDDGADNNVLNVAAENEFTIIGKTLLQAFAAPILIKCIGCEEFLSIPRFGIEKNLIIGLSKYCRNCNNNKCRFGQYNFAWLFVAGCGTSTTTTALSASSDIVNAANGDESTSTTTATATTTTTALSPASDIVNAANGGESTTTTTTTTDSHDAASGIVNGVNGGESTPLLTSQNDDWFGKPILDGTPLNTGPGFTWEQFRKFFDIFKNDDGELVCHLCKRPEICPSGHTTARMEYQIVGDSVVPAFNAPPNTSVSKKTDKKIRQLSLDHHPFGMTDGEKDFSKAMLCSIICDECNRGLTMFETRMRENKSMEYFYSRFNRDYVTEVVEYIKEKERLQLFINEWDNGIDDKNELCVTSCHSARRLINPKHPFCKKMEDYISNQLERLHKEGVDTTKRYKHQPRVKSWAGKTVGMLVGS